MIHFHNGQYFAYEMIGDFRTQEPWIHPTRKIKSYELILVKEGTVYLREDHREYGLGPGDMILLEPELLHGGSKESRGKTSFYWFHFYTDMPLPFKTAACQDSYDLHHYIKKLLDMTNSGCPLDGTADALGFMIFEELTRLQNSARSPVQSILEYIRINRGRDLSVRQIAEEFGYNPDYLGRLFKRHMKTGLKEYISGARLSYAKELLLTTVLSVQEVAKQAGYENANLFIKFFVYHEKITPTSFRSLYTHTHLNNT